MALKLEDVIKQGVKACSKASKPEKGLLWEAMRGNTTTPPVFGWHIGTIGAMFFAGYIFGAVTYTMFALFETGAPWVG